ncbi:MAG: PilZ domain-containing protein [Candidatus Omnitrophica bacterium]|nr:PilZ domain-containing protein [Candidatus Omnitrophota bacterium]
MVLQIRRETRRFPRYNFSEPLRFQIRGTQQINATICKDLSRGGIRFTSSCFISPKTVLMLEFSVLGRNIHPIARIVWSSPFLRQDKFYLGAEFIEWDILEKRILHEFLSLKEENKLKEIPL